jgi:formylglycine-generating enzyme required for sulfatase activity
VGGAATLGAIALATLAGLLLRGPTSTTGAAGPRRPPPRPGPRQVAAEPPAWLALLPAAERPPWPLPAGLALGERRGEFTNEKDGTVLLWVPPTTFVMGGDDLLASDTQQAGGSSASKHQVTLTRGYFIGKHEVTWGQLERFCDETGAERPVKALTRRSIPGLLPGTDDWVDLVGPPFVPGAEHPCMRVKWELAVAYCAWAGLRLPTEAEWELAARGKDPTRRFPWGSDPPPDAAHLNWGGDADGYPFTSPVGRFPEGIAPSGCLDMGGNVSEFCSDWMGTLGPEPVTDPVGPPKGERRVYRGGSWVNTFADAFATHFRSGSGPTHIDPQHGFRAARDSADP